MQDYINGLLGNPMFNLGVGLLQSSGPRPVTSGFGDVLAQGVGFANDRQAAVMRNQAYRDQLAASKRQQDAMAQLPGLLGGGEQGRRMGTLLQAFPSAAPSLLGAMTPTAPRTSAAFNDYLAMGGDPNDPAAFAEFSQNLDPYKQVQAALAEMQIEEQRRQQDEDTTQQQVSLASQRQSLDRTVNDLQKMYRLTERLKDTPLELGTPASEMIKTGLSAKDALSKALGISDTSEYSEAIADFNEFKKLAAGLTIDTFAGLEGIPRANAAMDLLAQSQPSPDLDTIANQRVIRSLLEETLGTAEIFGEANSDFEPRSLSKGYEFLNSLGSGQDDIDLSTMSDEELQRIINGR